MISTLPSDADRGSYVIEGIVAIGVFFLLLMLIVQVGFLILARSATATSVEAALRSGAVGLVSVDAVQSGLERDLAALVPGAVDVIVVVTENDETLSAIVRFRWVPPGPDFIPVTVQVERSVARVVPP